MLIQQVSWDREGVQSQSPDGRSVKRPAFDRASRGRRRRTFMMTQIHMWQLFVDIGLITSVMAMTMKALKASRIPGMLPKTRELEASLRTLISEAERAGIQLNDQLLRREQNIQKSLTEMQEYEARMTKVLAEAETLQSKLQTTRTETIRIIQDLRAGFERGMQSETGRLAEQLINGRAAGAPATTQSAEVAPSRAAQRLEAERASDAGGPRDDGEFVQHVYSRSMPSNSSTHSVFPPTSEHSIGTEPNASDLRRTYQSAELMIKEGQAVDSVASQMKLPVEGVKLLAQMIEIEREEASRRQDPAGKFATVDSRLGALGSMRRQSSLL